MSLKDTDTVTVTLKKDTVKMLRVKKRGLETWDELMCRLGERPRCGIECLVCNKLIRTDDPGMSRNDLAEANGWEPLYVGGVELVAGEGIVTTGEIGFACAECIQKTKKEEERRSKDMVAER